MLNNFQALKEFERRADRRLGVLGHSLPQEHIHLGMCTHKLTYPAQTKQHWEWTDHFFFEFKQFYY